MLLAVEAAAGELAGAVVVLVVDVGELEQADKIIRKIAVKDNIHFFGIMASTPLFLSTNHIVLPL